MNYNFNDKNKWKCIGTGSERTCYLNKKDINQCFKVSEIKKSKQSKREIKYLSFLKKMNIPFTHLPELYGIVKDDKYIGIIQEVIYDDNGSISLNMRNHMEKFSSDDSMQDKLLTCLDELKNYLLEYNIIPCDLVLSNILIQNTKHGWKAIIIDGFGTTEVIPYNNYIPFLGRKKIARKWKRFMNDKVTPYLIKI